MNTITLRADGKTLSGYHHALQIYPARKRSSWWLVAIGVVVVGLALVGGL